MIESEETLLKQPIVSQGVDPSLDTETGRDALLTPSGILDFTKGFIYGTDLVKNTTYLDKCTQIL